MTTNIFKYKHRLFRACNRMCADAFKSDRQHGLIYGPYQRREGGFYHTAEEWSMAVQHCVYCNRPLSPSVNS